MEVKYIKAGEVLIEEINAEPDIFILINGALYNSQIGETTFNINVRYIYIYI